MRLTLILVLLLLTSCGPLPSNAPEITTPRNAIVGGRATPADSLLSKYAVFIFNENNNLYCTGALLNRSVILTAAHCVSQSSPEHLVIAFGHEPLKGHYVRRRVFKYTIHDDFDPLSKNFRNDLALIKLIGTAPQGFFSLRLPSATLQVPVSGGFTALGYGRKTGVAMTSPEDVQGAGTLRSVGLKISEFNEPRTQFIVEQSRGRGICNGDSGGPGIMRYQGKDYVIGIASAIVWSKNSDSESEDSCLHKSLYMNIQHYSSWIDEHLKQLMK